MYATLPLRRLIQIVAGLAVVVLLALITFGSMPDTPTEFGRLISKTTLLTTSLFMIIFGLSGPYAPWRIVWRCFPFLNSVLFPDLNGKWEGTISSNWSVITLVKEAAEGKGGLDPGSVDITPLQADPITIQIKASLFTFRVSAKLTRTGGTSHSITTRLIKDAVRDAFQLHYVYYQDTPQAGSSDEASHLGAAALDIDHDKWELQGYYWTRRKWRQGMNTAGTLSLKRICR